MSIIRWCTRTIARQAARIREERAHNRHLVQTNERLVKQNDTLRLRLIDLDVDPVKVLDEETDGEG